MCSCSLLICSCLKFKPMNYITLLLTFDPANRVDRIFIHYLLLELNLPLYTHPVEDFPSIFLIPPKFFETVYTFSGVFVPYNATQVTSLVSCSA